MLMQIFVIQKCIKLKKKLFFSQMLHQKIKSKLLVKCKLKNPKVAKFLPQICKILITYTCIHLVKSRVFYFLYVMF